MYFILLLYWPVFPLSIEKQYFSVNEFTELLKTGVRILWIFPNHVKGSTRFPR